MGFIKPGKRIRRVIKRVKPKDDESRLTPTKTKKQKLELPKLEFPKLAVPTIVAFEDLPLEILSKIFIYAGPNNSLPLVNSNLNRLLKYDLSYKSLVVQMIRQYYIHQLNSRLDESMVMHKLNYYTNILNALKERWIQMKDSNNQQLESKAIYKKIISDFGIIQYAIECFKLMEQSVVISDEIFKNRFCNAELLEVLNYNNIFNTSNNSAVTILSSADIKFQIVARLKFFKFKFKEISMHLGKWNEEIDSEEVFELDVVKQEDVENYQEPIEDTNVPLPYYSNEDEVTSYLVRDEEESLTYDFQSLFEIKDVPSIFYKTGVHSKRKLQLMEKLSRGVFNVNEILVATLNWFEPRKVNEVATKDYSLEKAIKAIIQANRNSKLEQSTIVCIFKLYHHYESQDCSRFGLNAEKLTLAEDISRSVILLLELFYQQFPAEATDSATDRNDKELWHCIVELRNFNLAQLLMKFNECPDYDILRYLVT